MKGRKGEKERNFFHREKENEREKEREGEKLLTRKERE
jgi:hypothetical protein